MKKLHEIVIELEAELATCTPEDYPRVCVELCRHLAYVDGGETASRLNGLLATTNISAHPLYKAEALTLAASADMNQMKPEDASIKITQALAIARQHGLPDATLNAEMQQTIVMLYSGKPEEARAIAIECNEKALLLENLEQRFHAKTILSHVLMEQDQSAAGITIFEALQIAQKLGKGWLIAYAKMLLGLWGLALKQYPDSLSYFTDAKTLFKSEGAISYFLAACDRLGDVCNHLKQHEQALQFQLEALSIAEQQKNIRYTVNGYYSVGCTYNYLKQFGQAETSFFKSIALAKAHAYKIEEATAYLLLATLYRDAGETDKAIEYNLLGQETFGNNMRPRSKSSFTQQMSQLYRQKGDFEKAYQYLQEHLEIKLKLQDEVRIKETTRLQQLYEKEKRETELQELTIKQQQTELEQAESELKAIRAQMNPHFIFNALNTIQSYIYLNDKQNASNYLGKFSRLTRMVLDMSNHELVSLRDELEALTLYLELERMRFEEVLVFEIQVDAALDTESIKLPAMLIQPYLENAIKHGLLHKKDNRELYCGFKLIAQNLVVTIEDNGIGRQRSGELNVAKMDNHKSFATQANSKRFNLLNKNGDEAVGAEYTDKVDSEGRAAGTVVLLTIPVQFDGILAGEHI
ncbi:hypothetical protein BH09BAC1_BH09BAC1_19020 [soil metagenome]